MDLIAMKLLIVMVIGVSVAIWLALKFWERRNVPTCSPADPEVNVKAGLLATRARGWIFFNLALENRSRMAISVVDATFSIAGLTAKFQACPPSRETTAKIRCVVKPGEIFPVSLIELFYNAAGKPQGPYSFAVATTIRYRAHGDLFTQVLPLYRVKMIALSPNVLQRVRWYDKLANPPEPVRQLPDLEPADLKWLDADASQAA